MIPWAPCFIVRLTMKYIWPLNDKGLLCMGPLRPRLFSVQTFLCLPVVVVWNCRCRIPWGQGRWTMRQEHLQIWDLQQVLEPIPCEYRDDHTIYFLELLHGWNKLIYVRYSEQCLAHNAFSISACCSFVFCFLLGLFTWISINH